MGKLEDELIKIDVQIEENSGQLADNFKKASESASSLNGKIMQLEKSMAYLKSTGKDGSQEYKMFNEELTKTKKELNNVTGRLANLGKVVDINKLSFDQLQQYSNKLRKELNSVSKEVEPQKWDTLNQKFIETRKRMAEVSAGTKEVGDCVKMITNIVAGISIPKVLNVVAGAFKNFAVTAVEQTQIVGDRWNMFTAGMTSAYNQFVAQISTGNWGNLFKNIADAYRAGREIQALTDELFERNNSISIEAAKLTRESKEQERILKDVTKSESERVAAGEKIIENENRILEMKKNIAKQELEAAVIGLEARTKMSEADRQYFIDNYEGNRAAIKQAEKILELEEKYAQEKRIVAQRTQGYGTSDRLATLKSELDSQKNSNPEAVKAFEIMKKYNLANDPLIEAYVKATEKLINADSEFYQATMRTATRTSALKKEISEDMAKAADKSYRNEMELASKKAREETNVLKQQYASGALTKEQYESKMTAATQDMYKKQMAIAVKYGQDTTELEGKLYDAAIARRESLAKASADGYKVWLKELQKDIDATMKEMLKDYEAQIKSLEDSVNSEDQAEFTGKLKAASDIQKEYGGTGEQLAAAEVDFDNEMRQLDELHEMKFISEEAFENRKKDLIEEYTKKCIRIQTKGWRQGFAIASSYLNQAGNMVSSIQEAEMASLDAKMEAELRAAGDNADERAAIEEEYEAKKLEVQKKYADIDMGVKIAQAIANGALAITQCFATMPTLAAIPMAVILAATTAAQVATIVAQRNAIMNSSASSSSSSTSSERVVTGAGYSEGGYTGDGGRLEPAGIVHRGEYVVPQPEMRDPAVIARVREIEAIRTQRISSNRLPGFAEGGYTGNVSSVGQDNIRQLTKAIQEMNRKPMKAYVVLSDLQAQENLTAKMKKAASR